MDCSIPVVLACCFVYTRAILHLCSGRGFVPRHVVLGQREGFIRLNMVTRRSWRMWAMRTELSLEEIPTKVASSPTRMRSLWGNCPWNKCGRCMSPPIDSALICLRMYFAWQARCYVFSLFCPEKHTHCDVIAGTYGQ